MTLHKNLNLSKNRLWKRRGLACSLTLSLSILSIILASIAFLVLSTLAKVDTWLWCKFLWRLFAGGFDAVSEKVEFRKRFYGFSGKIWRLLEKTYLWYLSLLQPNPAVEHKLQVLAHIDLFPAKFIKRALQKPDRSHWPQLEIEESMGCFKRVEFLDY